MPQAGAIERAKLGLPIADPPGATIISPRLPAALQPRPVPSKPVPSENVDAAAWPDPAPAARQRTLPAAIPSGVPAGLPQKTPRPAADTASDSILDENGQTQVVRAAEISAPQPATALEPVADPPGPERTRPNLLSVNAAVVPEEAPAPPLSHLAFAARIVPIPESAAAQAALQPMVPALSPTSANVTPASPASMLPTPVPAPAGITPGAAADQNPPAGPARVSTEAGPDPNSRSEARNHPTPDFSAPDHSAQDQPAQDHSGHPSSDRPALRPAPEPTGRPVSGECDATAHSDMTMEKSSSLPGFFSPVATPAGAPPTALTPRSAPMPQPADLQNIDAAPAPAPVPRAAESHTISLRVADAGDQRVELKVTDRSGELHVTVRTAGAELSTPLRENLGDLVHRLEQSGFRATAWHPAQPAAVESNTDSRPDHESMSGGNRQPQQQQQQQSGRERREQDSRRARWNQEMEASFTSNSERSTSPWPASSTL